MGKGVGIGVYIYVYLLAETPRPLSNFLKAKSI